MIEIRHATIDDAEAILRVHYDAVHRTAAQSYPEEVLNEWSGEVTIERIARFKQGLVDNAEGEVIIVAVRNGDIIGFGAIVPDRGELRAVYVSPVAGRAGVGSLLLQRLEELAIAAGLSELRLDASMNAEHFYSRHGYVIEGPGVHRLNSGREMSCLFMIKQLNRSA